MQPVMLMLQECRAFAGVFCTKATGYPLSYDIRGDALFLFVSLTPSQSMPANKTAD